jgi:hypothetical protein
MQPMDEKAASGLGLKIIVKINELIVAITADRKADVAWKISMEDRISALEGEARELKTHNHGLKIAKGKAIAAQAKIEAKLQEARRLLH